MRALEGKRALVTGAARGIGAGIARAFAEAGAELFLHFRSDPSAAEMLAAELRTMGSTVHLYRADLGKLEDLNAMFDTIEREWGTLDAAVNNAGWDPGMVPLEEVTPELYEKLASVNIRGTLFSSLREIALMKRNPAGGSIINIGSVQQDTTVPGRTLYAMSKGAIHALTGELALEAGEFGIRVNNIAPGFIEVERLKASPSYNREGVAADIPLGRVGTPEDVGNLAVFLASAESGFISATPSSPTAASTADWRGAATPSPSPDEIPLKRRNSPAPVSRSQGNFFLFHERSFSRQKNTR